jgi:hypothetical protein
MELEDVDWVDAWTKGVQLYITNMDGALAMRTRFRFFELHLGHSYLCRVLYEPGCFSTRMSCNLMLKSWYDVCIKPIWMKSLQVSGFTFRLLYQPDLLPVRSSLILDSTEEFEDIGQLRG